MFAKSSEMQVIPSSCRSLERRKRVKNSSCLRNCLILATAMVFLLCGIILVYSPSFLGHQMNKLGKEKKSEEKPKFDKLTTDECLSVCKTAECIKTAAQMIKMMDSEVDPCNDFYSYSCGKYIKEGLGKKIDRQIYVLDIKEEIIEMLKDMMDSLPKSVPDNSPGSSLVKLRKFYDSCVNFRSSEEIAIPTAMKYLEYFGIRNWPYINSSYVFDDPSLEEALARLFAYQLHTFFSFEPFDDQDSSDQHTNENTSADVQREIKMKVILAESSVFTSYDGQLEEEYNRTMSATLYYFGVSEDEIKGIINDVVYFDALIFNVTKESLLRQEVDDSLNGAISSYDCAQGIDQYANMWCRVTNITLSLMGYFKKFPNARLILADQKHFHELGEILNHTSHRIIAHMLALKYFTDNGPSLNLFLRMKAHYQYPMFNTRLKGIESQSFYCASYVSSKLQTLAATAFYSTIYSKEVDKEVKDIFLGVKESLISLVEEIPWFDEEFKEPAKQAISKITFTAEDYIHHVSNISATDEFYEELQVSPENFIISDMEAKKFVISVILKNFHNIKLLEPLHRDPFEFQPSIEDAVIRYELGSLIFPLISANRTRYLNLGFFANNMGHEAAHELQTFLGDFEKSRNFSKTFEERKKCLEDQFSEYEIDLIGVKVKGNETFVENLSDYLGLTAVLKYFKEYEEKHGVENSVIGLNMNNIQAIFTNYAQAWCESREEVHLREYIDDSHSPAKFRVLGIYRHIEEFAEAFNCPLGSPMNPEEKCNFLL